MTRIPLTERIVSAALGAIFGALVGLTLAWLFGIYSRVLGPGFVAFSFKCWIAYGAGIFALIGFVAGQSVDKIFGQVMGMIFRFEDQCHYEAGNGLVWIVVVVLLFAGWWWFK